MEFFCRYYNFNLTYNWYSLANLIQFFFPIKFSIYINSLPMHVASLLQFVYSANNVLGVGRVHIFFFLNIFRRLYLISSFSDMPLGLCSDLGEA